MLNLLKYNSNTRNILVDEYSLLMISHANALKNEQLECFDGFVIDTDRVDFVTEIIKQIRTQTIIEIALLPIFVNGIYKIPKHIEVHIDGYMSLSMLKSYSQKISAIKNKINKLIMPENIMHQEYVDFVTLAYLYTRNKTIRPITSRTSLMGYEFPFFSLLFKQTEVDLLLKTLENLTTQKLLSCTLQDYVHLCKSCSSNYINYRECCPSCNSIDIKAHDIVHHFVCAHVAPEKDFKAEDGLECPKCDKTLRHIGIDYDKPSTIYSCNSCNHEFQNTGMKALCIDCSSEQSLDELLERTIGNYSITQKGENMLLGLQKTSKKLSKTEIPNLSIPLFKLLLQQEIHRVKITESSSYFANIIIRNQQLNLLNPEVKKELTKEINEIIKSYLKVSDIVASQSYNNHYVLLPETKENQLKCLDNIEYNLQKLLSDNVGEDTNEIEINYIKIKENTTLKNYIL